MEVNHKFGSILLILSLLFAGNFTTNGWAMDVVGYKNISVDEFIGMMDHKDFILINVHVPYNGEIPKTDLLIPFHAGPMGYVAAEKLVAMGYRQVLHFQGGMVSWKNAGKGLVNRPEF